MPRILSKSNLLVLAAFVGIGVDNVISADLSDYQILRNLYDATDGPNWKKNDGWSEDIEDDLCSWFGVECLTNTTSVFKLVLDDNELKGELPLEVLTLPKLDEFAIRRSPSLIVPNFEGITFAPHLKHLTFENAGVKSLSGIENATKLVALDISEHGGVLTGSIPDGLWDLTGLHRLWLDKNHLTGSISDKIGDIEGLEELDLHKNKLEMSIPKEIGQLVNIKKLSLGSNYFSGSIPTEIENLSSLEEVWFFENKLSGSLPKFENMSNLNKLEAQWNQLGGSISESFLKNTDSSTDMFIRLSHNSITGTIPGVLEKFESMTFHAEDNRFTGIESGLCNKGDWNDGWVDYYDCDGILCPKGTYNSYGRREKYKECHVCEYGGNDYLGSVTCNLGPSPTPPSSTPAPHPVDAFNGQKELLMELYNDLDGPNWNGNTGWGGDESVCKWDGIICGDSGEGVKIINLKGKGLMGTLPKSIFELPNLQEFNVHLNENLDVSEESLSLLGNNSKLTHVIFAGVKSLYLPGLKDANQLTYVDVSGNNIQGTIPNELFDLTNLKVLFLQDNEFSGSIPTKLNQLSNLEDVDFSGNKLEGELLIIDFVNLSKLGYLKLSFNYLTGTIPEEIFQHTPEFVLIHLDHNNFDGTLPSFSSSTTLASIDLSFNKLTGNIPDNFLDGMQDSSPMNIDLSHNLLAGTIPSLLGQFTALEINLVSNHFVAFDSTLCSDTNWAGEDSCDKVLCPLQTYNKYGREYDDTKCDPCETYTANYLGSTSCDGSLDDEVDKDILKEIYFECKGDNWVRNDGWNTDSNICNWYGVECTPATSHTFDGVQVPRVHKLDLQYNNVDCTESVVSWSLDQLFELSNLKILNMHGNPNVDIDFSAIPDLDNSAPVIEELLLAKVGIESADGVNYLQSLRHLDLSGNLLTIISPDIFKLTMLERLYLDQNQISGSLPTEIGYLTELESFDVFGNSITGTVPREMMQLNNLKDVEMGHNKLETTVEEVASIFKNKPKLWGLYFAKNDLTGRLDAFDQYPGLIELDLSNNKITGTIPSNFLFSVPGTRAHMKINLESNLITGTIPEELVRFDALQIDLRDNKISGIPPELCMKPLWQKGNTVTYGCDAILCEPGTSSMAGSSHDNINSTPILCKGCDVASQVPYYGSTSCDTDESIFDLEKDSLELFYKNCGGEKWNNKDKWLSDSSICDWYGVNCHEEGLVDSIVLGNNNVKCDVDKDNLSPLWNLSRLSNMWLYSNPLGIVDFSGIGKASNLTSLLLDSTGLENIEGIENAKVLEELDLRFNRLTGSFPYELFSLTQLKTLYLTNNKLTGVLPASFASLSNVEKLRLDLNSFSGTLPTFEQNKYLLWFDLSSNMISGQIPDNFFGRSVQGTSASTKVTIDLSDNMLIGTVPSGLSRIDFVDLYLKGNRFSSLSPSLCTKNNWNEGQVGNHFCDAIMCPIGTYNEQGRQTNNNNVCKECEEVKYMGSETCSGVSGFSITIFNSLNLITTVTGVLLLLF